MAYVIGWTPTSRGEDPDQVPLSEFANPFIAGEEREKDYPNIRSGHRSFTDNDYFYVVGGYTNEIRDGGVFQELWALSLATFEWRRYTMIGKFPESMASFAIVQLSPFSKAFLLFGGSGTIFGRTSSNELYLMTVNNDECTVSSRLLRPVGDIPVPIYGHSMCRGEFPGKYYIIGGTEGSVFNLNVHSLSMKINPDATNDEEKYTWYFEKVSSNEGPLGRYRLESNYDEEKGCLLFLGGGNADGVFDLDKIPSLNVTTRVSKEIATKPDIEHGWPSARRCHTLVRHKRHLIICGGIGHQRANYRPRYYSDMWSLSLDDYSWKKCVQKLPEAVFFHDTAVTADGWMLSFGGAHGIEADAPRSNALYCAWLDVPLLQRLAIEALRKSSPEMFSGLYCGNLRPSRALEIVNVLLKKGRREEKERAIMEKGKIRFHEDLQRNRHFLNDEGYMYIVRCEVYFYILCSLDSMESVINSLLIDNSLADSLEKCGRRLSELDSAQNSLVELDKMQVERRERDGVSVVAEHQNPPLKSVRDAMRLLSSCRNQMGECEIGAEIDKVFSVWQIVHHWADDDEVILRHRMLEEAEGPFVEREEQPGILQAVEENFNAVRHDFRRRLQEAVDQLMVVAHDSLPIIGIPIGEGEFDRDSDGSDVEIMNLNDMLEEMESDEEGNVQEE